MINGVPTLLYGVATRGSEPAGYTEVVHALTMTPGNWTTVEVAEVNTWEGGFSRLSLSTTGLVVGTGYQEASNWYFTHRPARCHSRRTRRRCARCSCRVR